MLLHLPFQALWHQPYWTTLVLSLLLALAAMYQVGRSWSSPVGWVLLPLMAIASKAFVEYASSGLENPLSYCLVGAFLVLWMRAHDTRRQLFWLSLIASGLILNRMDTVLLVGPALAVAFWRQRPRGIRDLGAVGQVLLGMLPLIVWELFSLLYYGFPFPNTAYAKLGMGIPQGDLWQMGTAYFQDSLRRDPVTLPMILSGVLAAVLRRKHIALGMKFLLPCNVAGDSLAFSFRGGDVLNVAWLQNGNPFDGVEITAHGMHSLAIPDVADAVALYPSSDWPHTVIGDVRTF